MEGTYYVCSEAETPDIIYFDEDDAFAFGFQYVYVFDEDGEKLISYKLNEDQNYMGNTCKDDYTTDFSIDF